MKAAAPRYQDILVTLARLLHANGVEARAMQRDFATACRALDQRARTAPTRRHLRDLPTVIAAWYSNPEFLDADGQPLALPLKGPCSLERLITLTLGRAMTSDVVRRLRRNGAIRARAGRYVVTDRRIIYRDDEARSHGLEALRGLLRTLERNLLGRHPTPALVECIASNPSIPIEDVARFNAIVRPKAVAFLNDADHQLTRLYRRRTAGSPTNRVGVGVYVFTNDDSATRRVARSRPARRS